LNLLTDSAFPFPIRLSFSLVASTEEEGEEEEGLFSGGLWN
jgi:hypothetical protein